MYIRHLGRIVQTFMKIGLREHLRRTPEALNTKRVGETGQSGCFVANLVNGAITCIPINNLE